jgi:hypothetical protein
MRRFMPPIRVAGCIIAVMMVAGCAGNPLSEATAPVAPTQPLIMNGRWILTTPNAPSCGMNFAGAAGGQDGTIAPEGGCPGNFYTSRHWTLAQGRLTIDAQNNQPLAQLTFADGRFEGKATAGLALTLSRQMSAQ